MQYRVMSKILQTVDNPAEAIAACKECIEDLHRLPGVKECFTVELKGGFRARFSKEERSKIISMVTLVNLHRLRCHAYDPIWLQGCAKLSENWPCVDSGGEKGQSTFEKKCGQSDEETRNGALLRCTLVV